MENKICIGGVYRNITSPGRYFLVTSYSENSTKHGSGYWIVDDKRLAGYSVSWCEEGLLNPKGWTLVKRYGKSICEKCRRHG